MKTTGQIGLKFKVIFFEGQFWISKSEPIGLVKNLNLVEKPQNESCGAYGGKNDRKRKSKISSH